MYGNCLETSGFLRFFSRTKLRIMSNQSYICMKTLDFAGGVMDGECCDGHHFFVVDWKLLEPPPYSIYVWQLSVDIGLLEVY
jgi:hypothetical protein